jgi:hypothetical protein
MNKFTQHIPNFASGLDPLIIEFNTFDELLYSEFFIKQKNMFVDFSHFALSNNRIILVRDNGYWWWVLGKIDDVSNIPLKKWVAKYRDK